MTTAEAAQKWAEAKEAKDKAAEAFDAANTAMVAAEKAEHEAWEALEALAGRSIPVAQVIAQAAPANPFGTVTYEGGAALPQMGYARPTGNGRPIG